MSEGVLYVEILPSTKGIGKSITKDLDKELQGTEKKSQSVFGKIAKFGVGAIAGIAVAVGGLALTGGISRALNIEDAQAKLKGLGHDTKTVDEIMRNALASVEGTAFGLDTAATVAASAVAAGIKPGKDLESVLKTVANAAAASGVSMDEMGSIFNKVATSGRAYTQEIQQVADRGLPIWQSLADNLGVTTDEVRKLASEGKIGFAEFEAAVTSAAGTVAAEMGQTTRGVLANMMTSFSKVGAIVVTPFLGPFREIANEVREIMGGIGERILPFFQDLQSKLESTFDVSSWSDKVLGFFDNLDIGALVTGAMSGRVSLFEAGVGLIQTLLEGLIGSVPMIVQGAADMVTRILDVIVQQGPGILTAAVTLFTGLVDALIQIIPQLISMLVTLLPQVWNQLVSLIPQLIAAAIELFMAIVDAIPVIVPMLIDAITNLLPVMVEALISNVAALIQGAVDLFMAIVEAIPVIIPPLIQAIADLLPVLITSVLSLLPALLDGAIKLFIALVKAVPIIIPALIDAILNLLPILISTVIGLIPQLIQAAIQLFEALIKAIPIIIPALIDAVIKIGPKLVDAVIKMVPMLLNAGKDLIRGLGDGIASMGKWIMDQIGKVIGGAIDWAKGLLGISSPSKVFFQLGEWTGEGFAEGIAAETATVQGAVDHMLHVPDMSQPSSPPSGLRDGDVLTLVVEGTPLTAVVQRHARAAGVFTQLAVMQGAR